MNLRFAAGRLLALFRKRRLDVELNGEILAHLEMAELNAIEAGLSPEEARREARRTFGGIEQMKEDHRDQRSVQWVENLLRDLRYGIASLARDPGFAAVTIGLLALGIGANTAMFSIVDTVLLKPLPFLEPERMVRVWEAPPGGRYGTTTLTFLDWKRQSDIFEALSVECPTKAALATDGYPARVSAPVVVLSHAFWRTQFAGDPSVLKRDLVLDGEPHRIIGVLPAGSFDRDEAVYWKPLIFAPDQLNRGQHWLNPIGRLRGGVRLDQARAKMNVLRASLNGVIYQKDWGFAVDPFAQMLVGDTLRRSIYLAFGAVLLVLLIACANVANLVLAKGYCGGLRDASCRSPAGGGIAAIYGRSQRRLQHGPARPWLCCGGRHGGLDTHGSASFLADFLRQAVKLIESGGTWIVGFERSGAPDNRHR